eukprot:TRINITY_DN31706_c0_g1_i1.p2 TRINITY_DN31706_c0_g1~~TRINITY_DN31706_c0_g1_i1.p2  ORF type:complete len:162 (-),score=20.13 TRINITY_DN31706_c0_g1_i1:87-572(-)
MSRVIKTSNVVRNFCKDFGNWPLVLANCAGLSLVLFVGSRKLMSHPDITCDRKERDAGLVATPNAIDHSYKFREGSGMFGKIFTALQLPTWVTGRQPIDVSTYGDRLPVPLDRTDYFNDGLFKSVPATYISPVGDHGASYQSIDEDRAAELAAEFGIEEED